MKKILAILFTLLAFASLGNAQTATKGGDTPAGWNTFMSPYTGAYQGSVIGVQYGGIGVGTLASNGILYGNGTGAVLALAVNSTGTNKFLTQSSSAAPAWAALIAGDIPSLAASIITSGTFPEVRGGTNQSTYTTGDVLYASATNTLSKLAVGGTGTVLTVAGGVPSWAAPSAVSWSVQTADFTAVAGNGYFINKGTLCNITLSTTAAVGATIYISGMNAAGWVTVQGSGVTTDVNGVNTTSGATGYIKGITSGHEDVVLVCNVANTGWKMISSTGTITRF